MNIFEISQELLDIFQELEENEGELTPELKEKLNITQESFKSKVKSYADAIKGFKGEIDTIDKEIDRLKCLKESKSKTIDRLSKVIAQAITQFGDETKSGGKFIDFGTGKISVRNTEKVEVDTERTDRIAKSVFNYFNNLAYTRELYQVNTVDYNDILKSYGCEDIEYNDLANIPATLTFDVNLKELLDNEGVDFMQTFFKFINNYKVKSNVSKTAMKDIIKEGLFDVSKIAHIEQNQSITIK